MAASGVWTAALAAAAVGLASPASADDRLDGDYTFINGPVSNTWNITTQCNAEVTCGGTISSSTGLVEQILRVAGGPWTIERTDVPNGRICPNGSTGPADLMYSFDPATLVGLQQEADRIYVDPSLIEYAVQLAHASREPARVGLSDLARYVLYGASPRSPISLVLAGRALAYLRGREYVVPEDVTDLALDVMRHRLVLSYEALSDEVTADVILSKILANTPVPEPAGRGR